MAEEKKKPSRTLAARDAIARHKATAPAKPTARVAAAATPAKPKKANPRAAKARDERAKARGRLPLNTEVSAVWLGIWYEGAMTLQTVPQGEGEPVTVKQLFHKADGLFRLMEELDIMFWNWLATEATDEQKRLLTFAPNPPAPAPLQNPGILAAKAGEPR